MASLAGVRKTPPSEPPQGGRGLLGLRRGQESNRHAQQKDAPLPRPSCPLKANFSSRHPGPLPASGARGKGASYRSQQNNPNSQTRSKMGFIPPSAFPHPG